MKRRSPPSVTPGYMTAWSRLFARSPEEIQAERQSRQPAPAPQTPNAQEGAIQPLQRTLAAPAVSLHHSAKRRLEHE